VTDLYAAEPAIIARLQAEVPALRTVEPASLVSGLKPTDIAKLCPAAFVVAGDAEPAEQTDEGITILETQQWHVIVCVANIGDPADTTSTCAAAGPLIGAVRAALAGWSPAEGYTPLALTLREAPYFGLAYAEFPLIFQTHAALCD
jgi:hypothetical protein